jgi:hypothetical protein
LLFVTGMKSYIALGAVALGCVGAEEMQVHRIDPALGGVRGDEEVRIEGEGFRTDIGYSVHFGPAPAASVIVDGDDSLVVTTPAVDGPRTVDVRIMSDDGRSFVLKRGFRYIDQSGWKPTDALDLVQRRHTDLSRRRLHR